MAHAKFDDDIDISRRNIGNALLGALGGAIGLSVLNACAGEEGSQKGQDLNASSGGIGTSRQLLATAATLEWADAFADLRGISTSSSSLIVIVGGHKSVGDGGGGVFYWNPNQSAADNDGTIVNPTGHLVNGRWQRIFSGALNVLWFGATTTIPTDDTNNNAFANAIKAASGGTLLIPQGTYRLTKSLVLDSTTLGPLPASLEIVGEANSVLDFLFPTASQSSAPYNDGLLINGTHVNVTSLAIRNLTAGNNYGTGIDAVALPNTSGGPVYFTKVFLVGWKENMALDGYETSVVDACTFAQWPNFGVGTSYPGSTHLRLARGPVRGRGNNVSDNTNAIYIKNCGFYGGANKYIWHEDGYGHTVRDCNFEMFAGDKPVYIGCPGSTGPHLITYTGCTTEGATSWVTIDSPGYLAVQGLSIEYNQLTMGQPAVVMTSGSVVDGVRFSNNVLFGGSTTNEVIKTTGASPGDLIIEGNHSSDAAFQMVSFLPTLDTSLVYSERQGYSGTADFRAWQNSGANGWNGEMVCQALCQTTAGGASVKPFSDMKKFPILSVPAGGNLQLLTLCMEAIGRAYVVGRCYHRKQRLVVALNGGYGPSVIGLTYPDQFETSSGDSWPAQCVNLALNTSNSQIEVTVNSHPAEAIHWQIILRLIARGNP